MSAGRETEKGQENPDHLTKDQDQSFHTPVRSGQQYEEIDIMRAKRKFSCLDSNLMLLSLICFVADTVTDVFVCVQYFRHGHMYWASLTLAFVLVPSMIVQLFSARWYAADGNLTWCSAFLHCMMLQPLERYVKVLMIGCRARSSGSADQVEEYYFRQNDVCMLRLFEAFLESAPQLTLQLYIMVATSDAGSLTSTSAAVSLVSLGWAMAAYSHALRQAHREDYRVRWGSLLLHTLWHLAMIAARVSAIVAFASTYKGWIFVVIGIHWWLMTMWTYLQNTDFCPSVWEERLFNIVVGIVYCFCFFSLKEGRTRWRRTAFYSIVLVENLLLIGLWFPYRDSRIEAVNIALLLTVVVGFVLGLFLMLSYYRWCHPSSPISCFKTTITLEENHPHPLTKKPSLISTLQGELMPRHKSCIMLSRKSLLKSATNIKQEVEFKEAETPALLTPAFPRHLDPHRKVIDYDKTFSIEEAGMFQHYSIDTSNCVRSIASKCAPYDFTGVDLSVISAVPREGSTTETAEAGKPREHVEPPPGYLENPQGFREEKLNPGATECRNDPKGSTPPDTPFRSPPDYGCDFATVTCSTPYTDLDKPRKLTVREGSRNKQLRMRTFDDIVIDDAKVSNPLPDGTQETKADSKVRDSPSSGIGSMSTPGSSEEGMGASSCDQHHSNCACGMIGHLSPVNPHHQLEEADPSCNNSLNTSCYDNLTSPVTCLVEPSRSQDKKEPSPKAPRDQYQSSDSLGKETALLRGLNTL